MNKTTQLILLNLPSVISIIAASILLYKNKEGWGWFLFAALLLCGGMKVVCE